MTSPLVLAVLRDLEPLAQRARPRSDDDWGSVRQIDAENRFFRVVKRTMTPADFADLEDYCLRATTDEAIDEALRMIGSRG